MSNYEFIGMALIIGIPLIVSVIAIMKPIVNLNSTITKLDTSLKIFVKEKDEVKGELTRHEERLDDHEKRIYYIEHNKE